MADGKSKSGKRKNKLADAQSGLTPQEVRALSRLMSNEKRALRVMHEAYWRLRELGWWPVICPPEDGIECDLAAPDFTDIPRCVYKGEWPDGAWWTQVGDLVIPVHPILYRPQTPKADGATTKI